MRSSTRIGFVDAGMRVRIYGGVRNIVMTLFHWLNSSRTLGWWNNMSASRISCMRL